MTTQTPTLASFLLQRIAEVEETAREAIRHKSSPWRAAQVPYEWTNGNGESGVKLEQCEVLSGSGQWIMRTAQAGDAAVGFHIARHDPARVLARCAADRAIVARHTDDDSTSYGEPCETLRYLAAVFADHPDYREEWRP